MMMFVYAFVLSYTDDIVFFLSATDCPNPDTTTSTDDDGFDIAIVGTSPDDVTDDDLLSMSNNTFCSNVTIELTSKCDEGVARIMIVQIDVEGVSAVKISLLGEGGVSLPNGVYMVNITNFLPFGNRKKMFSQFLFT